MMPDWSGNIEKMEKTKQSGQIKTFLILTPFWYVLTQALDAIWWEIK